jgi:predicted dehydrogenase
VIRVVIVGLGSIGLRHLANIRAAEPDAEITVLRHCRDDTTLPEGANRVVYTLDDAIAERPDVGFVCGPTRTHASVGVALAQAGVHLFVEKPLALDAAEARRLVDASAESGRILIVGYNLRFSVSLRALHDAAHAGRIGRIMSGRAEVGRYLPDWRPSIDYRTTNSARAVFGGGVVLELSHEIDYMRWLLGEVAAIDAVVGRLSDLEIDVDDTADLLFSFTSGSIASIHMDMTQRSAIRQCRLNGTNGTLTWDGLSGETRAFDPNDGWTTLVAGGTEERNAMYLAEIAHMFACVRGEAPPFTDGLTGVRIVELAQAAVCAARQRRRIAV